MAVSDSLNRLPQVAIRTGTIVCRRYFYASICTGRNHQSVGLVLGGVNIGRP